MAEGSLHCRKPAFQHFQSVPMTELTLEQLVPLKYTTDIFIALYICIKLFYCIIYSILVNKKDITYSNKTECNKKCNFFVPILT